MRISKQDRKHMYADALEARLRGITLATLFERRKIHARMEARLEALDKRAA